MSDKLIYVQIALAFIGGIILIVYVSSIFWGPLDMPYYIRVFMGIAGFSDMALMEKVNEYYYGYGKDFSKMTICLFFAGFVLIALAFIP